jgi:hypothetical protein
MWGREERRYNSTYLSPKLNGDDRSTSLSARFIPTERSSGYPMKRRLGRAEYGSFVEQKNLLLLGKIERSVRIYSHCAV